MNILYEDNALVVLNKPAGLSSEEGVPAALRQHWDTPDAFVGVVHRLDTGVSGRAAQKVAEKLAQVSRRKQVLCVTHLPQLAAMADTHFSVEKGERDGRTYTRVVLLDREQRKAELARITGGSHVTEALLASAGELLDQAERYRSELGMRNHAE